MRMQSIRESLCLRDSSKEFNLEDIIRRAKLRSQAVRSAGLERTEGKPHQCKKCRDETGYIIRNEAGFEVWTICECKEKRLIERLFSSSQITPQFQQKSLADFQLGNRPQMIIDAYHCTKAYVESFSDVRDGRQNS